MLLGARGRAGAVGAHLELATEKGDALAHADDAVPSRPTGVGGGGRVALGPPGAHHVLDLEAEPPSLLTSRERDRPVAVPGRIGQRLLDDAVEVKTRRWVDAQRGAGVVPRHRLPT